MRTSLLPRTVNVASTSLVLQKKHVSSPSSHGSSKNLKNVGRATGLVYYDFSPPL